jgi:hypothetical protein
LLNLNRRLFAIALVFAFAAQFLAAEGADYMAARFGGELDHAGKLAQLEGYLGRRGITLQVGDEFLPAGKVGGFNAVNGSVPHFNKYYN